MACKTKKTKLKKYSKGSTLPKKQTGGLSYMDETSNLFTPNSSQYSSLANNTQFNNPNSMQNNGGIGDGINLNSTSSNNNAGFNAQSITGDVGKYLGYVQAADTFISGIGEGDAGGLTRQDTQDFVDQLGGAVGGAYYQGGKAVDQSLFGKDEQGLYGSELEASASYFLTDPAQAVAQASQTWQDGNEWKAVGEILLPGLAGSNYQKDREKEIADQEAAQKKAMMDARNSARLNQLNSQVVSYGGLAKYGGRLKKYQNGSMLQDPTKVTPERVPIGTNPNTGEYIYGPETGLSTNVATLIPNIPRPTNQLNTIHNVKRDFNINKEDFLRDVDKEYMDSLSGVSRQMYLEGKLPYQYTTGYDSDNKLTLDMLVPNKAAKQEFKKYGGNIDYMNPSHSNRPTVFQYGGQTHEGPDEGIEVDGTGIPSIMSGEAPVALTEKGEVAFKGPDMESAYIFSDSIKYKKI